MYEKGSKPKPDPSVLPIIEECRRVTNVMPGGKVPLPILHMNNIYLFFTFFTPASDTFTLLAMYICTFGSKVSDTSVEMWIKADLC